MHPWLIHFPPVPTYGLCALVGVLLAWGIARILARRVRVEGSLIDLLIPVAVGAGLLGAYGFGSWTDAVTEEAVHGQVLVGSLICATVAGIGYALMMRIPLGVLGDICAAPVAAGVACGRLGCFFAGCCYGKISAGRYWWDGVCFPKGSFAFLDQVQRGWIEAGAKESLPVWPVQLYEAGLCLMLAGGLMWGFRRRAVSGERFLYLGIGYAVIRFGLEFLRADNPVVGWGLTFSQIGAVVLMATALVTLGLRRKFAEGLGLRVAAR